MLWRNCKRFLSFVYNVRRFSSFREQRLFRWTRAVFRVWVFRNKHRRFQNLWQFESRQFAIQKKFPCIWNANDIVNVTRINGNTWIIFCLNFFHNFIVRNSIRYAWNTHFRRHYVFTVIPSSLKTFFIYLISSLSKVSSSPPASSIKTISSYDTVSLSSFGLTPNKSRSAFVETLKNQIIGFKMIVKKVIIPHAVSASFSLCFIAHRLGTSFPNTSVKYDNIKVIRITETVLITPAFWDDILNVFTSRSESPFAKLSAANAEPRNLASVTPNCIVERNFVGSFIIFNSFTAFLLPSFARDFTFFRSKTGLQFLSLQKSVE